MGSYVNFSKHIEIASKTSANGFLRFLGYADIDKEKLKEIAENKKLTHIQISRPLPNKAYQLIDRILSLRPDLTFRIYHFIEEDKIDLSVLLNMPHLHRLSIDSIHLKDHPDKINLEILTKLNLKSLSLECFDLRDYGFIQNLSDDLEEIRIMADTTGPNVNFDCTWLLKYANLNSVWIGKKAKKNLECLSKLPKLNSLALRGIKLTDFAFLKQMKLEKLALLWCSNSDLHELAELKSLKEIELWRISQLSDVTFLKELENLEVIKLQDLKHVKNLPDLSGHKHLQRIFLIDTGIQIKQLPDDLRDKVSNWDDR